MRTNPAASSEERTITEAINATANVLANFKELTLLDSNVQIEESVARAIDAASHQVYELRDRGRSMGPFVSHGAGDFITVEHWEKFVLSIRQAEQLNRSIIVVIEMLLRSLMTIDDKLTQLSQKISVPELGQDVHAMCQDTNALYLLIVNHINRNEEIIMGLRTFELWDGYKAMAAATQVRIKYPDQGAALRQVRQRI